MLLTLHGSVTTYIIVSHPSKSYLKYSLIYYYLPAFSYHHIHKFLTLDGVSSSGDSPQFIANQPLNIHDNNDDNNSDDL